MNTTKERDLWRVIIAHVLKVHRRKRSFYPHNLKKISSLDREAFEKVQYSKLLAPTL